VNKGEGPRGRATLPVYHAAKDSHRQGKSLPLKGADQKKSSKERMGKTSIPWKEIGDIRLMGLSIRVLIFINQRKGQEAELYECS